MAAHLSRLGRLDVLVNCAGIAGPTAGIENISLADWRQCLAVNLDAMFLFSRRAVPIMKDQSSGNLINIASTAGWHGYPLRTPYAASKSAVIGLTRSLAMELGPWGIRANVICPGSVAGDRMDRVITAEAREKGVTEAVIRSRYTESNSLKTFIDAEDIADMACFLASSQARRVTGQVLNVDGNLEAF
jgi:NAD(P)-dependent dehydrogenase (short-subunit alcohol dehydrogenase family)